MFGSTGEGRDMDYMAYGAYHRRSDNRGNLAALYFSRVTVRGSLAADLSLTEKYLKVFTCILPVNCM